MYILTMKWSVHIAYQANLSQSETVASTSLAFSPTRAWQTRGGLYCYHLSSSTVSKDNTNLMADDGRRPGVLDIPGFGVESTRIRDFYPAKYKVAHFIWIWVRWDLSILLPSRPLFSGPKTVQASVTLLEQLPTFLEKSYRCFFLHKKRHEGENIFM